MCEDEEDKERCAGCHDDEPGPLTEYDGEYLCSNCIRAKEEENEGEIEAAWDAYNGYGDSDGSSAEDWVD